MKCDSKLSFLVELLVLWFLIGSTGPAQQPPIQITSPVDGSVITSGQTITITVSADPSVQVIGVLIRSSVC